MTSPSEGRAEGPASPPLTVEAVFHSTRQELDRVERILVDGLESDVALISQVGKYIFESGGKRMRPLLTILSSRLCGCTGEAYLTMAAVAELIHTATLLHDDVVDHADLRRGARSVNRLWNSETSILVGDFLFTRAFCMMVDQKDMRVLEVMSQACRQLAEGEILELAKVGDPDIREGEYLAIVRDKTAVLMAAACRVGAILGRRPEWEEDLATYGMSIGMAFQLVDDVLDYAADEEELGKTIGKDLQEGKVTLPIIRTLERCTKEERRRLVESIRSRSLAPEDLHEILQTVRQYDGLQHTHERARGFVAEAKARLGAMPDTREKAALTAVAEFVAARKS